MKRNFIKRLTRVLLTLFILLNVVAAIHAYKFTHFSSAGARTSMQLTSAQKLSFLFSGVNNPRPVDNKLPARAYQTIKINSNVTLDCWYMPADSAAKETVIIFHGYTASKSGLLERASVLLQNGYNCLLVDFMGSGGSGGNGTTIGYKEAEEVKSAYDYVQTQDKGNIFLCGTSMGAVAIMKAIKDYKLQPKGIILECPFGTMYETVCARFRMVHMPTVPSAGMLVFWGGVENGFWGFSHNPVDYARSINCPTLLQYGEKDDRVTRKEIDEIYANIPTPKKLATYPLAGHDNFLAIYKNEWSKNIVDFLNGIK